MVLLAAAPFGWTLALALGALTLIAVLVLASVLSPLLVVDGERLLASKVSIPLSALGSVAEIAKENLSKELGPGLDARAQLVIRGDLKTAVRIEVTDEADPTPYLIVSSRRPSELVRALRANKA